MLFMDVICIILCWLLLKIHLLISIFQKKEKTSWNRNNKKQEEEEEEKEEGEEEEEEKKEALE